MNYWIIADTHFGHNKMIEYCQRPERFEWLILDEIKAKIKPSDILIHLGDFSLYTDAFWNLIFMNVCQCNQKWLLRGNHDRRSLSYYLSHGWSCVADEIKLLVYGRNILFSHRPADANRDDYELNIHGHHHNTRHHPEDIVSDRHLLVFLEHKYEPVSLKKLLQL